MSDKASKTIALHDRIYAASRVFDEKTRCVIHTHSTHCVALSLRTDQPELLPAITPYFVMKVGHVPHIPYHRPGDPQAAAWVAQTIADYGLKGERSEGETGVWLDVGTPFARKICAMGVRCSRWVTMHGWGFNVNTDLGYFKHIIACGIPDKAVASLNKELGHEVNMVEIKQKKQAIEIAQ